MTWFSRTSFSSTSEKGICAEIKVPADSDLFDGHFPDEPILPGVAQLALVIELLKTALDRPVAPQSVSRVRFKKIIRPEDTIKVNIAPKKEDELIYGFSLTTGADRVCSGTVTLTHD